MGLQDKFNNALGDIKNADQSATSWVATNARWIIVGAGLVVVAFAAMLLFS